MLTDSIDLAEVDSSDLEGMTELLSNYFNDEQNYHYHYVPRSVKAMMFWALANNWTGNSMQSKG